MANRRVVLIILMVLLFYVPSNAVGNEGSPAVEQFGHVFEEVVIADSSDLLSEPRDLEFHPGTPNQLWIANRATDSITIVDNTGLENQTSENRRDSHRNHFLEEVSAIAFGAYHPEFDWQWGSAQETDNTYCGQQNPGNNFMGPTLWPSSLSHFAMEHQNDALLGSHIDMNHESPFGVGIAHDSENAYWYNDGYYGELVYYDFQEDHDTGMDDHSDAIVRRYSDVQLSHVLGTPGHMILDDDSGILYIADPGANRVLWVNTDDSTYTTQNIMGDSSRLEPLAEYSRIAGIEWGVLDTGLNRPSGIALTGDQLFVSQNGDGSILAYDLSANGKSASEAGSIQTSASSIMGLEIGPNGHLYYVDNVQDEVVRIDPYTDGDGDGVVDVDDNCPLVANVAQLNHDGDSLGDVCDEDDDNDGYSDVLDSCPKGSTSWVVSAITDHDMDGCHDSNEDYDDDDDDVIDIRDDCSTGDLNWLSTTATDYDQDGCQDQGEDRDDDDDGICDAETSAVDSCIASSAGTDMCLTSSLSFTSTASSDADQDGCEDRSEDEDDDNDALVDKHDDCPNEYGLSDKGRLFGCPDSDGDGYANSIDVYPEESTQWSDLDEDGYGDSPTGFNGDACPAIYGTSNEDRHGCVDSDNDGWSNADSGWLVASGADAFPNEFTQHLDQDGDGFGDAPQGFQADACIESPGTSYEDQYGCLDSDNDGWSDEADALPLEPTQHSDADGDGYGDNSLGFEPDSCPNQAGTSNQLPFGCNDGDGDGWADSVDFDPANALVWSDVDGDQYPDQAGATEMDSCIETPGQSYNDRYGCPDADGDGWSDASDKYPNDSSRYAASVMASNQLVMIGLALFSAMAIGLLFIRKRQQSHFVQTAIQIPLPDPTLEPAAPAAPPLPEGGLPPGWTTEQWAWYGEDYLRNS